MARTGKTSTSATRKALLSRSDEAELGRQVRSARDAMRNLVLQTELGRVLLLRRLSGKDPCETCGELLRLGRANQAHARTGGRGADEGHQAVTEILDGDKGLQRLLDAVVADWSGLIAPVLDAPEKRAPSGLSRAGWRAAGLARGPSAGGGSVDRRFRRRAVFGHLLRTGRALEDERATFLAARERFVAANQRLVFHLTKRFEGRGVSRDDLVQEGNLGLVRAAEQFDHRLGFRFSTYAVWWVRQALARAVAEQAGDIRLPYVQYERVGKVSRATRNFLQAFGREPTPEELASRTELSERQVETTLGAGRAVASLQQPAGQSGDQPLGNFMADEQTDSPCEAAERRELIEQLAGLVDDLPEREAGILRLRFGMDGQREHTLEEIGQMFELTRERIRQLEARALNRLRKPSQRRLLDCLEPEP